MWLVVDWEHNGQRIKLGMDTQNRPRFRDNAPHFAFQAGLTYTFIASGSFGTRILKNALFDVAGTSLFPKNSAIPLAGLAAVTSSHVISYLLRVLTQDLKFNAGYVAQVPLALNIPWNLFYVLGSACIKLKMLLVEQNPVEDAFLRVPASPMYHIQAVLHTLEGWNELAVCDAYQLSARDRQAVVAETGTPAGWYPLLAGYDRLPDLAGDLDDMFELPQGLDAYLATHTCILPGESTLAHLKAKLRLLYAAGPRSKNGARAAQTSDERETINAYTRVPIPTETFLEELSIRMHLHPLSVYWLLEELQTTEDLHCKLEERRLLEDRLSVLVLRLLGHRWPRQIEICEPPPDWADSSGSIPLVPGTGYNTLAERVRLRLRVEEGVADAQRLELRLRTLTGLDLEQWLRASFFERHISQFKLRPIAWHLASTPARRSEHSKAKRGEDSHAAPAFACLLSYHACTSNILTRIRAQYIEPLVQSARKTIGAALLLADHATASLAQERIRELEEFSARLLVIEQQGFACPELQEIAATEPLDRWSGDGAAHTTDQAAFQRAEAAWRIDLNDGVRVNIAPLQLAGVLTREVLNPTDARKALSDRAHWRAEERRWVRAGKLCHTTAG
jgi:hypothetical protein